MYHRPTSVSIDLEALVHNFRQVVRMAGPGCPIAAVVKSNAYGHGCVEVVHALLEAGADRFAVSLTEEGLEIRESGVAVPVLILGCCYPDQAKDIVAGELTPVVTQIELASSLNDAAKSLGKAAKLHIKVETGLGRLGVDKKELPDFLYRLQEMPFLQVEGICSTFSSVDNLQAAEEQLRAFEEIAEEAANLYGRPLLRHMAHTGGSLRGLTRPGWLIRPGIMLYGYTRGIDTNGMPLRPVLSWKTQVFKVQSYPFGHSIGYGGNYKSRKDSEIALLPVGYSDGLLRSYVGKGEVLIRGVRAPLVGRFCMDWIMAEVGHIRGVHAGDEAVLIGRQGLDYIGADEMADRAGTIIDEVFVSISNRVPRVYRAP